MTPLDEIKATIKTGSELFTYQDENLKYTLLDFWKWSVSDILSNATRGRLAEFIVATATNIDINIVRNEWSPYDLITPNGIKLEIKSASYLQSWYQKALSSISFSIKLARHWDSATNKVSLVPQRHADVYVFCVLKHQDKQTINPLNFDHWEFYVLATKELNNYTRSQHSITLNSLKKLTVCVQYNHINDAIIQRHLLNKP